MLDDIKKEMSEYSNTQTHFMLKQANTVVNKSKRTKIKSNEKIITSKSSPRGKVFKLPADDNTDEQANSFNLNRTG